MSKQLVKNYTYNTAAKTVTLSDFTTVSLERLQLITNVTTNQIIYNFADSTVATATVSGNVITLSAAPGTSTDKLMVIYDAASGDPTYDGNYKEVPFTTTTVQAVGTTDVSAYKSVSVHIVTQGTTSTTTFQVSNDGTNWVTKNLSNISSTNGIIGSTTSAGLVAAGALTERYFRINVTGITAGTTAGVIEFSPTSYNYQQIQAQSIQNGTWSVGANSATGSVIPSNAFLMGYSVGGFLNSASGTNGSDSNGTGGGINSAAYNYLYNGSAYDRWRSSGPTGTAAVAGSFTEVTGTAAALNANIIPSTDVSAYKWLSLQVTGTWSGTLTYQGSNDNVNFSSILLQNITSNNATPQVTTSGNTFVGGPISYRYFRVQMTSYTSGTASAVLELYTAPATMINPPASQTGSWSVGSNSATGSAVPANAFYMGVSGSAGALQGLGSAASQGDATSLAGGLAVGAFIFNGTNFDRPRAATSAAGTTGTGVPAAGMLGFDGTNYQRAKMDTNGTTAVQLFTGTTALGTSVDNADAAGASGTANRLLVVNRNTVFNGTSYDRMPGNTTGTFTVPRPTTSGGVTVAKIASAATTNATSVKATAGQIYGWSLFNTSAATRYLKFYNLATAPTVGTSVPTFIVPLPAGGGSNIMLGDLGTPFSTGIAYSISTGVADTDATATAANDVVGSVYYA